ncbi:MAG: universal stress protein [Labilithrix sp.]|nr:universal stress protein [Labilithrix sp.]
MATAGPVVVATDLTDASRPALERGRAYAAASGAPLVVCHVVLDVLRHHPLMPHAGENDLLLGAELYARAGDLVNEQVRDVLGGAVSDLGVTVESGAPDEEIVRLAEASGASLIVVGAKPREGARLALGHVAERVVRYAHASVLVAREGPTTGKVLATTDFSEGSLPALRVAGDLARAAGAKVTLLHVVTPPSTALSSALMPFGDTWSPPPASAVEALEALGRDTLASLTAEHGLAGFEQRAGEPADVILQRAEALDVEMIVTGSRGRRGLARLVLGSVAEKVIRSSSCSVLVAREPVHDSLR